jgi:hypothetical protein
MFLAGSAPSSRRRARTVASRWITDATSEAKARGSVAKGGLLAAARSRVPSDGLRVRVECFLVGAVSRFVYARAMDALAALAEPRRLLGRLVGRMWGSLSEG